MVAKRAKPRLMEEMTVKDVIDSLEKTKTVVVPVGGTEQHGHHLPLNTDAVHAYELAKRVSKRTGCVVAPLLSYSHSYGTLPGTTNIQPETLKQVLIDICSSLVEQGFTNVVILLGHGEISTICAGDEAARHFRRKRGCQVVVFKNFAPSPRVKRMIGNQNDGHAAKGETSFLMYLRPDLARKRKPHDPDERWWLDTVMKVHETEKWWMADGVEMSYVPAQKLLAAVAREQRKHPPLKYGVFGDPTEASPEIGRAYIDDKVKEIAQFVRELEGR